jgi:hypothetical protein
LDWQLCGGVAGCCDPMERRLDWGIVSLNWLTENHIAYPGRSLAKHDENVCTTVAKSLGTSCSKQRENWYAGIAGIVA